jgi:antitoxin component YwqK of YwqJK toxin-antitoxin module
MNLYIVNFNQKTKIYMKIENIPFNMSKEIIVDLNKNNLVSFFSEDGEVHITLSKNNEEIYHEVYKNPKPLNKDGYISISHYNKNKKLHTHSENIPSFTNTIMNKVDYHKNGKLSKLKSKKILEDNYGEYTLLNKIRKELKEVRCYTNGFRQYIEKNGNIEWIFNKKLHSPSNDIPAIVSYFKNGSVSYEEYHINGKEYREDEPAHIRYNEDGSIAFELYIINNELHREDGPAIIHYYDNGSIESEEYYFNSQRHREDGPAFIKYYKNGSIQLEEYYINGEEQT